MPSCGFNGCGGCSITYRNFIGFCHRKSSTWYDQMTTHICILLSQSRRHFILFEFLCRGHTSLLLFCPAATIIFFHLCAGAVLFFSFHCARTTLMFSNSYEEVMPFFFFPYAGNTLRQLQVVSNLLTPQFSRRRFHLLLFLQERVLRRNRPDLT